MALAEFPTDRFFRAGNRCGGNKRQARCGSGVKSEEDFRQYAVEIPGSGFRAISFLRVIDPALVLDSTQYAVTDRAYN